MLNPKELAYMQSQQGLTFSDTCDVVRSSRTSDGAGGTTEVWANVYTGQKCRIASEVVVRADEEGIIREIRKTVITMSIALDVRGGDRVVVNGHTYVVSGESFHSWRTAQRLTVVEVV